MLDRLIRCSSAAPPPPLPPSFSPVRFAPSFFLLPLSVRPATHAATSVLKRDTARTERGSLRESDCRLPGSEGTPSPTPRRPEGPTTKCIALHHDCGRIRDRRRVLLSKYACERVARTRLPKALLYPSRKLNCLIIKTHSRNSSDRYKPFPLSPPRKVESSMTMRQQLGSFYSRSRLAVRVAVRPPATTSR